MIRCKKVLLNTHIFKKLQTVSPMLYAAQKSIQIEICPGEA